MKIYYISETSFSRLELAQQLGDLLSIDNDFSVYEATPGDNFHFVLDRNNNWRVFFDKNNKEVVNISYRYGESQQVKIMSIFDSYFQGLK